MKSTLKKSSKKSTIMSRENPHEENILAIRKAYSQVSQIAIDKSENTSELRVNHKANLLIEMARSAEPMNGPGNSRYKNLGEMIINSINLQEEKYADFDSNSQHSSEGEMPIEASSEDIQGIVISIAKDPQPGRITFISKLPGQDKVSFKVVRVKGLGNQMPKVNLIRSFGGFSIFQFDTNSHLSKVRIEMYRDDKLLKKSKDIPFSARQVLLDLDLSYNFERNSEMELNFLEGLLASCCIEGQRLTEEIIRLIGKKQLKSRVISQKPTIDRITKQAIRQSRNKAQILKLLKMLLEEQQFVFGQPSASIKNPSFQTLISIFMQQMLNFKAVVGRSERQQLSLQQNVQLIELFVHYYCLQSKGTKGLSLQDIINQIRTKTQQFLQFTFTIPVMSIYNKMIRFCKIHQIPLIDQGYDTIKSYINDFGLKPSQFILANFQNIYYHSFIKKAKNSTAKLFIEAFQNIKFQTNSNYEKQLEQILNYSNEIFSEMNVNQLSFSDFQKFFKTYWIFRQNAQLVSISRSKPLRQSIKGYMSNLKSKMQQTPNKTQAINLVLMYFITSKDEQLVQNDELFRNLCKYIFERITEQSNFEILVKFYFQIFKRGTRLFTIDILKDATKSFANNFSRYTPDRVLTAISKHFNEDYLSTQQLIVLCNQVLLKPILQKIFQQSSQSNYLQRIKMSHQKWHNRFIYSSYFNQQILERMVKIIQNKFKSSKMQKESYLQLIKEEIFNYVSDDEKRSNLLIIIEFDSLTLDKQSLWIYFTEKPSYIRAMIKIKQKGESSADDLRSSLQEIAQEDLTKRIIPFSYVQAVKSMRPNEWNNFVILTEEYNIPLKIEELQKLGSNYIKNIQKLSNFVNEIGQTFNSPNYQDLIDKLTQVNTYYQKQSMSKQSMPAIFTGFPSSVLTCYKFQAFFAEQNLQKKPIEEIIKTSIKMLDRLYKKIDEVYINFERKSLLSDNLYYFQPNKDNVKEFRNIMALKADSKSNNLQQIVSIYEIMANSDEILSILNALVDLQAKKFRIKTPEMIEFVEICTKLKNKSSTPLIDLRAKFLTIQAKLNQLKLNITDKRPILQMFACIVENEKKIIDVTTMKDFLKDYKDEVNENGGEVTYQEIEDYQTTLEYYEQVYQVEASFAQFIGNTFKFMQEKAKGNKQFNLPLSVKTALHDDLYKKLKEEQSKFSDTKLVAFNFIDEVTRRVRFQFTIDPESPNKMLAKTTIYPQNKQKKQQVVQQRQIFSNKQKAIMISYSLDERENAQKKKQLSSFLQIVKCFEQMKEVQLLLVQNGYSQFQNKRIQIEIVNSNVNHIKQYVQKRETELNDWKKSLQKIHDIFYRSAHIQGKQMKQFYDFIAGGETNTIPNSFQIIINNSQLHNQIIKQLRSLNKLSTLKGIELIQQYLIMLSQREDRKKAQDRQQNYIDIRIMAKDIDFIKGIQQIGSQKINNLKYYQLLICTSETSKSQIEAFFKVALRDPDSEYIVLGYQNLDRRKQQVIVDQVRNFKNQYGEEKFRLKLCLVGDSEMELLFKFATEYLGKSPQKKETVQEIRSAYEGKIRKSCERVMIVHSKMAGIGKTTFIEQDSKARYNRPQLYFLPLSGNMALPETQRENNKSMQVNKIRKFFNDRILETIRSFQISEKTSNKASLVLQIYNIEPAAVDEVNMFITSIIFSRYFKYDGVTTVIPEQIPIYIQLQNVSLPAHTAIPEQFRNKPPQLKLLSFLRQIKSVCGQKIVKEIFTFEPSMVKINPADKQLNYILRHLQLLKNKQINATPIPNIVQYAIVPIPDAEARALLTDYFFKYYMDKKQVPSGYLWAYYRKLLFEASRTFSGSFILSVDQIKALDTNISLNKTLHASMKLKQTFRGEFYETLVNNCIQFIQRTVRPNNQNSTEQFKQALMDLPFLIIPNVDGESFSFIYNNSNKVPNVIKSLIVMQTPSLTLRINTTPIDTLFEQENIASFEKVPNSPKWIQRASQILANISGNRHYKIDCEKGYIVNIDNFFKMCLMVQRVRLNIPIVIMGEAGIGKTALLRHVVNHLFKHKFAVYNINAGLPLQSRKNSIKEQQSLQSIVQNIKQLYDQVQQQNRLANITEQHKKKKLWIFFDEFNTLREVGFFKEIIIDGRYLGVKLPYIQDVVMMAACNPHKKLQLNKQQQQAQYVNQQADRLAFDVLPAPHSLMECMWNYGALTDYQYQKYISKMLSSVRYKNDALVAATILGIHRIITKQTFQSAVSLRDIDRFRQLYGWFANNLPKRMNTKIPQILGNYNNIEERAFIMSAYFTYILRFDTYLRQAIQKQIEQRLELKSGYVLAGKLAQQSDLCSRLSFTWDSPIAVNDSLKENIYTCFVCINTRLPLLIIGAPGCSKSLSLRILTKNLKEKIMDEYLRGFKKVRQYPLQGSQNTVTQDIKAVFDKAYHDFSSKGKGNLSRQQMNEIPVVVFDQIGLAQKSKDNPLKVLHPYLQVNREDNLDERILGFIGISNSQLDVSKMSRLLVLRRPPAGQKDLQYTAQNIAKGFRHGQHKKVLYIVQKLAKSYIKFLQKWKLKKSNFPHFFGLRDFYAIIKIFMQKLQQQQMDIQDDDGMLDCAFSSILQNFNGWQGTFSQFKGQFQEQINVILPVKEPTMKETLQCVLKTLQKQSLRYPLVIVDDYESLCFVKWKIESKYGNKVNYMEGSPFVEEKEYSLKLLGEICRYMQNQSILILSKLSEGVKTGLYDFFNKSFNIRVSNNNKYLRIRTQEGSLNTMQYLYNPKFNCIYILQEKQLQNVEPPFLSRFQKFRFSLTKYIQEIETNLLSKIKRFIQKVEEFCRANSLQHFSASNLFINCNESALQSLVVASMESEGIEKAEKEAIRRLIMNSGQYFFKIYKHFIEPKGEFSDIKQLMEEVIQNKNNGTGQRSLVIRFSNDANYTKKLSDKSIVSAQFVTFKKEADLEQQLAIFFKNETKKTLYITMNVGQENKYLNYVTSLIEKVRKRSQALNFEINQKKIRILYIFNKSKEENSKAKQNREESITHFTKYRQQFDDGKLEQSKNINKRQLFTHIITIQSLFSYAMKVFDFQFDLQENSAKAQAIFLQLNKQIHHKDSILSRQAEDITLLLQPNIEMNEEVIKEMLLDKEIIKKYKNYREAITKSFSDRKLLGALAVFIRYLCDKEAYMSYSGEILLKYMEEIQGIHFGYNMKEMIINLKGKSKSNYSLIMSQLLESRKQFIVQDYRTLKMTKKLPTADKKFLIKVNNPRFFPFSKAECSGILQMNDKSLTWYIKQIYSYNQEQQRQKFQQAYKIYEEQFKSKTKFMHKQKNLYNSYINEDKDLKALLFLDLLTDFCEQKGVEVRYLEKYYEIVNKFFLLDSKSGKSGAGFSKMAAILVGYEDIWVELFSICKILSSESLEINYPKQEYVASEKNLKKYIRLIYEDIHRLLLGNNVLTIFKNKSEKYLSVYLNILFHLEKIETILDQPLPQQLKSTRTTLVFIQKYDPLKKSQYILSFLQHKSKIDNVSHYQIMLKYFQDLKEGASKEQIDRILQFQANQLFLQWFKVEPKNQTCMDNFLSNLRNQSFAHNSVATINLFIQNANIVFRNVEQDFKNLCNLHNEASFHIRNLGEEAKKSIYKNNISILLTNVFMQKIAARFKDNKLVTRSDKTFQNILNKVSNSEVNGIAQVFAFAYFKLYLKQYIIRLDSQEKSEDLAAVDNYLSKDTVTTLNLKFYCLKILRTLKPIKQIKNNYIKVKRANWIHDQRLKDIFYEQPSRSILVPRDEDLKPSAKMQSTIAQIIQSLGGNVDLIDELVNQSTTMENRYTLFNFFMRYYFSRSYQDKNYREKLIQKIVASKAAYQPKIGKLQYLLLLRYAESKFDDSFKVDNAEQFKEDQFVFFNSLNWLLASKKSISPLHSLFFNEAGQVHANINDIFESMFFPCGPENNFIYNAQSVTILTRNNDVGVYLCSDRCDYIYSHFNCGWPNQSSTCQFCKQPIGCIPGKGHTINRSEQGARRIISPFVKNNSSFYVSSLKNLTSYWEMQRFYIQAQINRMKKNSTVKMGTIQQKITGFQMGANCRVSQLTLYFLRQMFNSVLYCLLSLGAIPEAQNILLFKGNTISQSLTHLLNQNNKDLEDIKKALNLDMKIYGWMYGLQKKTFLSLISFRQQFNSNINTIDQGAKQFAAKMQSQVAQNKISATYHELYKDMARTLKNQLLTKELMEVNRMDSSNSYTRDFFEEKVQSYIKAYTTMEKFTLAEANAALQGKMQFPNDIVLTQDSIDEAKFQFSRIFKIPDKQIKCNQIFINFQLNIRQNYPFLDYVLKNSDNINSMSDFYNVLNFTNELTKEVEFNYQRKDSLRSIEDIINELKTKKEDRLSPALASPQVAVDSWNRLASKLDVLQNDCTIVGRMSSDYTLKSPIQAFLLDNSTKQNLYGLFISSLFHNFAKMHNQLVILLNARKNQIPQFKCLNLYNETKKVHPQKLQQSDVYLVSEKEMEQYLYSNSISSINYGKNYVFNNFDTYQQFFVLKLQGKCEIISQIKKFKSVCYNGEAFAQTSESSNTLTEVRDYFYVELSRDEIHTVKNYISGRGNAQAREEYVVKLRGELQKTMIAIRNLNGVVIEARNLGDFISSLNFEDVTYELKNQPFGEFQIAQIVHFYEVLQLQLKPFIIQRLPQRYKEIMNEQTEKQISSLIRDLPLQGEYAVSLIQFGYALYRFISRILQGGVQQNDKKLMEFLPYRSDFWPKDFEDYKLQPLMENQTMSTLTFANAGHLFDIVERNIKQKVGASKI